MNLLLAYPGLTPQSEAVAVILAHGASKAPSVAQHLASCANGALRRAFWSAVLVEIKKQVH